VHQRAVEGFEVALEVSVSRTARRHERRVAEDVDQHRFGPVVPAIELGQRVAQAFIGVRDLAPARRIGGRIEAGPAGRAGHEQRLGIREVAIHGGALNAGLGRHGVDRRSRGANRPVQLDRGLGDALTGFGF
jgi:hypothetical protein